MRQVKIVRNTLETEVELELNLDGSGRADIDTGIGFLDHMLTLFAFHGKFDLKIHCKGDLYSDTHHTAEDIGIVLGQGIRKAIGDKKGIDRYGYMYLPMDESLVRLVVDLGGRPYLVYNLTFKRDNIGTMATEDFKEFFLGFANNCLCNLHIDLLYGENDHHKIEAVFKAFARAMKKAVEITSEDLQSTKGVL